jgi:hypothetical protein
MPRNLQGFDLSHKKSFKVLSYVQYIFWMILCRYAYDAYDAYKYNSVLIYIIVNTNKVVRWEKESGGCRGYVSHHFFRRPS